VNKHLKELYDHTEFVKRHKCGTLNHKEFIRGGGLILLPFSNVIKCLVRCAGCWNLNDSCVMRALSAVIYIWYFEHHTA